MDTSTERQVAGTARTVSAVFRLTIPTALSPPHLIRFATALRENKLLDEEHTELLIAGKVASMGSSRYAYGFSDELSGDGVRVVGHNGGAPGIYGQLLIFPDSGYVVAVLANRDPQGAIGVIQSISSRLPAK